MHEGTCLTTNAIYIDRVSLCSCSQSKTSNLQYITVMGPKGGSTITGQKKVAFLTDTDKNHNVLPEKAFLPLSGLVSSTSAGVLLRQRGYFSFIVDKSTVSLHQDDKLFIVSAAPLSCDAIWQSPLQKTTEWKNASVEPFYSPIPLGNFDHLRVNGL